MLLSYFLLFTGILFALLPISCNNAKPVEKKGTPLIYLDFDEHVNNSGLLKVSVNSDNNVSYCDGISNSALDLSNSSKYRNPVIFEKKTENNLTDYPGVTFLLWTRTDPCDPNEYFIFGQKEYYENIGIKGWHIGKSLHGSWSWWFSDGVNYLNYSPTVQRQPINNNQWHLIGFSIDYAKKESRLYYDGDNVAIISLENIDLTSINSPFYIGCDPLSSDHRMDTYNGNIDEIGIWPRVLTTDQIASVYAEHIPLKKNEITEKVKDITFLTWDIWQGGRKHGRFIGVQRVIEIIKQSGADVIAIQEMYGSGETIADQLGFYYYQRSSGIGILSRYPIGTTYNIFKPQNVGAANIDLPDNKHIIFCPIYLNNMPDISAYVSSGIANPDTITAREMKTRGAEMRYILWGLQSLINNKENVPVVIAGDFNTGSHLDWTEENKENHFGLTIEFPVSKLILDASFIDSYREIYPDETTNRGITSHINLNDNIGDRTDFIYYTGSNLKIKSSSIIDTSVCEFPSDHAAVISSFSLK